MPADRLDLRRRLTALAATQSGYFTAAQARRAGYSYQAQKYHADRGTWTRVDRGLYRLPEWPRGEHDDLVRWTLWSRSRAVVSHETALVVHDLSDVNPARVHLTVPPNFRSQAPGAALHRADLPDDDILVYEGFRVTSPLRTLLNIAGRDLEQTHLRAAVEEARACGITSLDELLRGADEFGPRAALRIERALRKRAIQ